MSVNTRRPDHQPKDEEPLFSSSATEVGDLIRMASLQCYVLRILLIIRGIADMLVLGVNGGFFECSTLGGLFLHEFLRRSNYYFYLGIFY
jgi:hypothetical protein